MNEECRLTFANETYNPFTPETVTFMFVPVTGASGKTYIPISRKLLELR
jgi:hypothetical protein